jgi:hypothetical protein
MAFTFQEMGLTAQDVLSQAGSTADLTINTVPPNLLQHPSRKTNTIYLWKIRNGVKPGTLLALSFLIHDMEQEGISGLRTPCTNQFIELAIRTGLEVRTSSKNNPGYLSTGFLLSIADAVGVSEKHMRYIFQGVRASSAAYSSTNDDYRKLLLSKYELMTADDERKPPSKRMNARRFEGIDAIPELYNRLGCLGRVSGAFLPYELEAWEKMLSDFQDQALPFTGEVLHYYQTARVTDLQSDTGVINPIRELTGVHVDRHTFEHTLGLVCSDFPLPDLTGLEITNDYLNR